MAGLFICLDCGGSKTSIAVCDGDGKLIARALGGTSNLAYLGRDAFLDAVEETVAKLPKVDGAPLRFAKAWVGISGCDAPAAADSVRPGLGKILGISPGPNLLVANDTHLLASPLALYPDCKTAVAVVAGTGSICVAFEQKDNGKVLIERGRVGGYGWILGDEGGGFYVGREAVRQLLIEDEKVQPKSSVQASVLKQSILNHFDAPTTMDVLTAIHAPDPLVHSDAVSGMLREKRLSSLAPLVFEAAYRTTPPDAFALRVLEASALALAQQIISLLDITKIDARESVICFGGSLVGNLQYRDLILGNLAKHDINHIFKHGEFIDDAALSGAITLSKALNK